MEFYPGCSHRSCNLDRGLASFSDHYEPDEDSRASDLPLHGDAAGNSNPRHRAPHRLLWGYGTTSRIAVCVIISLFPIIVNTLFGLQFERGLHDLFTLHHASRLTRLRKLMFPAARPAIFADSYLGRTVSDWCHRWRLLLRPRCCWHRPASQALLEPT